MTIPDPSLAAKDTERFPFLFGSQYYRAPTPETGCWETDFRNMQALGFNAVKLFVQWRWSHRGAERFYFDDLDRLMDLAARHGLGVTLNFLLDVAPLWLYGAHPDAKQIDISGRPVEPYAVGHRQIGGHPGPCYRHPGALADRKRFVAVAVEHFRGHPALQMWDVWNEPELCFPQRTPNLANMVCYCPHCAGGFREWLRARYSEIDRLNAVWGRCYEAWEQVELPRGTGTITDFVDWREFHLDAMSGEAAWRLETVRGLDLAHGRYLHVVPNCWFSAVTCADDFAMAENCEVFAATMNGQPGMIRHVVSAGRGKVCYNVESHLNFGALSMHQRRLGMEEVLRDFLPQLGAGIKGILFWQYRAEILGQEAPSWGLVHTDGRPRPVTEAVRRFWATIQPHASELRRSFPSPAEIGVWRSRKNEIFHFCAEGFPNDFNTSIDAWLEALYWDNLPHGLISGEMLARGELEGLKLLIMPNSYYVTQAEADALDRWVRDGGVLICEAHLAGYNGTTGRHSRVTPGCGLAESWGIRETDSTSSMHLRLKPGQKLEGRGLSDDVRKALKEFGVSGGKFYPIRLTDGRLVWGAHRYAELGGDGLVPLGSFDGSAPCLARKEVGKGVVFYCGTNLGQAAAHDPAGLEALLAQAADVAGIEPVGRLHAAQSGTVHLDLLSENGRPRFAVLLSKANRAQEIRLDGRGCWRGLFSGAKWSLRGKTRLRLPANFAEIFRITE
jgi:beta-galactosidase